MKATISTAAHVDTDLQPGLYRVSKATGLCLQVSGTKSKSWVWRYRLRGKRRDMGLGPTDSVRACQPIGESGWGGKASGDSIVGVAS